MKRCGARTRRGTSCQRYGIGRGGRCALHGGKSTGARTAEGVERIRAGQRKRWETWRKANPAFLVPGRSLRTARRIKHLFRQRQKLRSETRNWLDRARAREPATAELLATVEQAWRDHVSAQAEKQRQREAQRLTPEQEALANRRLEEWADVAMHLAEPAHDKPPAGGWARQNSASPSPVAELKKVEQKIDSLPSQQVRAFERHQQRTEEDRLHLELRRRGADLPTASHRPGGRGRYHRAYHRRSTAK